MTIELYGNNFSPACRAVLLTAKALNIEINIIQINLQEGEHLKPEFLKINPQHTIPTIVDDGFALAESRAIITYLVNKYGEGSTLYPEEPKARAIVDQRLYFDIGTLYQRIADYFYPIYKEGKPGEPEKLAKIQDALAIFNNILEGQKFSAGTNLTLADLSLVAIMSTMTETGDISIEKYDNIKKWYETIKVTAPGYKEINEKGIEIAKEYLQMVKNKKK